jgi:hypothetical protein
MELRYLCKWRNRWVMLLFEKEKFLKNGEGEIDEWKVVLLILDEKVVGELIMVLVGNTVRSLGSAMEMLTWKAL